MSCSKDAYVSVPTPAEKYEPTLKDDATEECAAGVKEEVRDDVTEAGCGRATNADDVAAVEHDPAAAAAAAAAVSELDDATGSGRDATDSIIGESKSASINE